MLPLPVYQSLQLPLVPPWAIHSCQEHLFALSRQKSRAFTAQTTDILRPPLLCAPPKPRAPEMCLSYCVAGFPQRQLLFTTTFQDSAQSWLSVSACLAHGQIKKPVATTPSPTYYVQADHVLKAQPMVEVLPSVLS